VGRAKALMLRPVVLDFFLYRAGKVINSLDISAHILTDTAKKALAERTLIPDDNRV
jgi:hypothetical protein